MMTRIAVYLTSALALTLLFTSIGYACWQGLSPDDRPSEASNNLWYAYNDSDTVIVFVHGVLSDSRSAWYSKGKGATPAQYWPAIVRDCEVFNSPSVFLGGFYTEAASGAFSMRDAANQLFSHLTLAKQPATAPVLDKPNILFVTHSTGGIVVRHILVKHTDAFVDKTVGLLLMASPSLGSRDANHLDLFIRLANHRMGKELQWDNAFVEELDKDFKNLVYRRTIPGLVGAEALENHYVLPGFFGTRKVLVNAVSGARYFAEPTRLADTDHFSAVKPNHPDHPAHIFLRTFFEQQFVPKTRERGEDNNVPVSPTIFHTKHDVLEKRGVVSVRQGDATVAIVPFNHQKAFSAGIYAASAQIDSEETLRTDFQVSPQGPEEVRFDHEFTVEGVVTDGQGKSIPNVTVSIGNQSHQTGNDGVYIIRDVPMSKDYTISAQSAQSPPWRGTIFNQQWNTKIIKNITFGLNQ